MSRFPLDASYENLDDALAYTESRLSATPDLADVASSISALIGRLDALRNEERDLHRNQIAADAGVDAADARLDELVEGLSTALRTVYSDPDGAIYRRYFRHGPESVVRLGLASQLEVVRSWPDLLKKDGDPNLEAGSEIMAAAIQVGDAAIAQRVDAAVKAAKFRVQKRVPFVEDVNAVIAAVRADLERRMRDVPGGKVEAFFR